MLTLRNKLFRNPESSVLPATLSTQKISESDTSKSSHDRTDFLVSSQHTRTQSFKNDSSLILQHHIHGMIAQLKTRYFNHVHLSGVAQESMTSQKAHWLAKILHLPSTEISQFHPDEISNFEQDHKGAMLLIRLDEYHELEKLSTGQSRIFSISIAPRPNTTISSVNQKEDMEFNSCNTTTYIQGCKTITSKKTNNMDAFGIFIPNGSPYLDITVQVYAKSKISRTATLKGALKASKSKAKIAYHNILNKLSPTTSQGSGSLFSELSLNRRSYDSRIMSPECDTIDRTSIMSSSRNSNGIGMSSMRQNCTASDEPLVRGQKTSQLGNRQIIAQVTFRQEIDGSMFHQPTIQLQLTKPSDPGVIIAELRLGVAVFLNRQDWMDALVANEHQNNILLAKELYPTICYSDYLTVQIHQSPPKIPIWNRYWAILQGFHISLFDFQYKESRPAEFILELKHIIRVKKSEPERIMQPNSFVIVAENGTRHYVFTDSESSRQEWMRQIEAAIKRCRPAY